MLFKQPHKLFTLADKLLLTLLKTGKLYGVKSEPEFDKTIH